jgi:hypothetical protein
MSEHKSLPRTQAEIETILDKLFTDPTLLRYAEQPWHVIADHVGCSVLDVMAAIKRTSFKGQ